jgi:hypothetical protein
MEPIKVTEELHATKSMAKDLIGALKLRLT